MKKLLFIVLLVVGCEDDDNGSSSCDSSTLSGTWDIYSEAIYPLGCIGGCIYNCENIIDNVTTSHSDSDFDMKIQSDCRFSQYRDYNEDGWDEPYSFNSTELDVDTFEICPPSYNDDGSCFIINKIADDTLLFMFDNGQYMYPDDETNYCKIKTFYLR